MALVNPHPALKVSVPMNPMVDGWMGDDWFHNGAFRQQNMTYIYEQEATRKNEAKWWTNHFDDYDVYMEAGSAGELGRRHGLEQVGFWRKVLEHPVYDAFWRDQAMDRILAVQPLKVPVMLVHSLWDQEDIYGAIAVYKAIKPKDTNNDKVFLVMGPWHHGQEIDDASTLGVLKFGSDTGLYFRQQILRPFLDQYLKDGARKADVASRRPIARLRSERRCSAELPLPDHRSIGDLHHGDHVARRGGSVKPLAEDDVRPRRAEDPAENRARGTQDPGPGADQTNLGATRRSVRGPATNSGR